MRTLIYGVMFAALVACNNKEQSADPEGPPAAKPATDVVDEAAKDETLSSKVEQKAGQNQAAPQLANSSSSGGLDAATLLRTGALQYFAPETGLIYADQAGSAVHLCGGDSVTARSRIARVLKEAASLQADGEFGDVMECSKGPKSLVCTYTHPAGDPTEDADSVVDLVFIDGPVGKPRMVAALFGLARADDPRIEVEIAKKPVCAGTATTRDDVNKFLAKLEPVVDEICACKTVECVSKLSPKAKAIYKPDTSQAGKSSAEIDPAWKKEMFRMTDCVSRITSAELKALP